ncbi:Response regulator receiver domain-containing protein [Granulicella rosea]|uniref:Response regulator receiver domain-containing protein n=1 Tax=Granulicella rosea TaxID=474952 RepID=A0A239EF93_9BACT|nr:response regulator [Granulicella rosea]SNS42562.1 Response regulator receiver domain-containing protein [Granulicella rosea]
MSSDFRENFSAVENTLFLSRKNWALVSIVDDDESILTSTDRLLRSAGYHVATFDSAEAFFDSQAVENTRCLILDVLMPGLGGLEAQSRINETQPVPIIFVTAHEDSKTRNQALNAGAYRFFGKPFDSNALLAAIDSALSETPKPRKPTALVIGADTMFRVPILLQAGYYVRTCPSLQELCAELESGMQNYFLCVFEQESPIEWQMPAALCSRYSIPVVMFRSVAETSAQLKCELRVEPLTSPQQWLAELQTVLNKIAANTANMEARISRRIFKGQS